MWWWSVAVAYAGFWERPLKVGYTVGVNVVVALGAADDRSRMGLAVDGQYQRFWADSPYWTEGSVSKPAPLITAAAHVGWNHPVVWAEATLVAGPMLPFEVGDGGFRPLLGAQGGAGLQLATDGSAGPVLVGAVVGPFVEARVESVVWHGWHAPRLMIGPTLSLSCCSYLL
jgi:hypothetical protein